MSALKRIRSVVPGKSLFLPWITFLASGLLFYLIFLHCTIRFDDSREQISFIQPKYIEIIEHMTNEQSYHQYRLLLYIEATNEIILQNQSLDRVCTQNADELSRLKGLFSGIPVIFVHGHAGSYKQCRSFASYAEKIKSRFAIKLDYFTLDFAEELSAFSGSILQRQVEHMKRTIQLISDFYAALGNEQKIILIGHSMGGIVAKGAAYMNEAVHGNTLSQVKMVITLNTPHARSLGALDRGFERLFSIIHQDHLSQISRAKMNAADITAIPPLVSFSTGTRDIIIPSELSRVEESNMEFTLNVMSSEMPLVWGSMGHQESLWNFLFVKALHLGLIFALQNERTRTMAEGIPRVCSKALLYELAQYWRGDNMFKRKEDTFDFPEKRVSYSKSTLDSNGIHYAEIFFSTGKDIYFDHQDLTKLMDTQKHIALVLKGNDPLEEKRSSVRFSTNLQHLGDYVLLEDAASMDMVNGRLQGVTGLVRSFSGDPSAFYPISSRSFYLNSLYPSVNVPFHSQMERKITLPAVVILFSRNASNNTGRLQSHMFFRQGNFIPMSFSPTLEVPSGSYFDMAVYSDETHFLPSSLNSHQWGRLAALFSWDASPSSYISIANERLSPIVVDVKIEKEVNRPIMSAFFSLVGYLFTYLLNYDAVKVASSPSTTCLMGKISIFNFKPRYQALRLIVFLRVRLDVMEASTPPHPIHVSLHSSIEKKRWNVEFESFAIEGGSKTYRFSQLISLQDHFTLEDAYDCLTIEMLIDPRYEIYGPVAFAPEMLLGISRVIKWYIPWLLYFYPVIFCLFAILFHTFTDSRIVLKNTILYIAAISAMTLWLRRNFFAQSDMLPLGLECLLSFFSLSFTVSFLLIIANLVELSGLAIETLYRLTKLKSPIGLALTSLFNQLDRLVVQVSLFSYAVFPFHPNLFFYFLGVIYFQARKESLNKRFTLICLLSLLGMVSSIHGIMILIQELAWKWRSHPFAYFPNKSLMLPLFETVTFGKLINVIPQRVMGLFLLLITLSLWLLTMYTNPILESPSIYVYPLAIHVFLVCMGKHRSLNKPF